MALTLQQAAAIILRACETISRGRDQNGLPKLTHRVPLVRVVRSQQTKDSKGRRAVLARVPTSKATILSNMTGVDCADADVIAGIVACSDGGLFTDGTAMWDRTGEAARRGSVGSLSTEVASNPLGTVVRHRAGTQKLPQRSHARMAPVCRLRSLSQNRRFHNWRQFTVSTL